MLSHRKYCTKALSSILACSALLIGGCSDSDSDSDPNDASPPSFEGVTSVSASGGTNLLVEWNAATDDSTSAANMRYRIFASLSPTDTGVARTTVTGSTSAKVVYLEPGNTYYVTVEAVDEAGNTNDNSTQEMATTNSEVSLALDVQPVLQAACATSGCHDAAEQLHGVDMSSAAQTHATLVDVENHHCGGAGALRVASGGGLTAIANSQLLNLVNWESATPCQEANGNVIQMPAGGAELDHEFIHILEHWIEAGAPNN